MQVHKSRSSGSSLGRNRVLEVFGNGFIGYGQRKDSFYRVTSEGLYLQAFHTLQEQHLLLSRFRLLTTVFLAIKLSNGLHVKAYIGEHRGSE